ncbi:MAG: hypothetical protein ACP5O1_00365 [Phycisphaerae bacterium]
MRDLPKLINRSAAIVVLVSLACTRSVSAAPKAPKNNFEKDMIKLAGPTFVLSKHQFSMPAAFWNEHLCNWLDVALCGRPSNFLHETVLSVETTRTIMRRAMQKIGFHLATQWAPNFKTFGKIRGEPVLILVRFPIKGKMQTFLLDELIRFNGWSRSAGPLGWLYLGTPGIYQLPKSMHDARPGQMVTPRGVIYNDPQIAMNFRGIRSQSQALLDHSLCTDNWIYPDIRFYRNYRIVPISIFNSNGKTPVTLIFRRVSEAGLMRAVIRYWHSASMRRLAADLLPLAKQMDTWRRNLWSLVHDHPGAWENSSAVHIDAAQLQHGYAVLTHTFVRWSLRHSHFSPTGSRNLAAIKLQASRFEEHLSDQVKATEARVQYAQAESGAEKAKTPAERKKALASEIEAKSKFLLYSNLQYLRYWTLKFHSVSPKDPRQLWVRMVKAQYASSKARDTEAHLGIAYAKTMTAGNTQQTARYAAAYERSLIISHLRALEILELQYEFRISNDNGFASKKRIAALEELKNRIKKEIDEVRKQLSQMSP